MLAEQATQWLLPSRIILSLRQSAREMQVLDEVWKYKVLLHAEQCWRSSITMNAVWQADVDTQVLVVAWKNSPVAQATQ
jgi:hypothetical protein